MTDDRNQPGFEVFRASEKSRFVILCDHASNRIPAELGGLGLGPSDLARHIAWDIGAAGVAEELSSIFDAPAILCTTSRLVIDCNRHPGAIDFIPEQSDGTMIPGNWSLSKQARLSRIERWFAPYHAEIESVLRARAARGLSSFLLSIHSMTPCLAGKARPWQIALSSHVDRSIVQPVLDSLRRLGDVVVGDNQPYDLDPLVDYSIPFHAMRRNLQYLQVEFRQDQVEDLEGQAGWAQRFAGTLSDAGLCER
jgi:predicted N-formylglutamate amidohydrolase